MDPPVKKLPRPRDRPMVEACGPVQINAGENFYIGATIVTNNTARCQEFIEALFWLNTCVEQGALHATNDVLVTVDSLHVKGLIEEKFMARKKESAGHVRLKTDEEKNTTPQWLGTRTHRRLGRTTPQIAWQMLARARNF